MATTVPKALVTPRPISKQDSEGFFAKWASTVYQDSYTPGPKLQKAEFNNLGSRIATIQGDRNLKVWQTDKPDRKFSVDIVGAHDRPISDVAWSPVNSDQLITCSSDDKVMKRWDVRAKQITLRIPVPYGVQFVRYSASGEYILYATTTRITIRDDGNETSVGIDEGRICEVEWSNNKDLFAVALTTGQIYIYQYRSGESDSGTLNGAEAGAADGNDNGGSEPGTGSITLAYTLQGHRTSPSCLAFDPNGEYLVSASNEGIVSFWDTGSWICVKTFSEINDAIVSLSFSVGSEFLAIGATSQKKPLSILHVRTNSLVYSKPRPSVAPALVRWHPIRYTIASTGDEAGLLVYNKV